MLKTKLHIFPDAGHQAMSEHTWETATIEII